MYRWSLLIPELWPPDDWAEVPDVGRCQSRSPSVSARSQHRSDKTEPTRYQPGSTGYKEEQLIIFCCLDKLRNFIPPHILQKHSANTLEKSDRMIHSRWHRCGLSAHREQAGSGERKHKWVILPKPLRQELGWFFFCFFLQRHQWLLLTLL